MNEFFSKKSLRLGAHLGSSKIHPWMFQFIQGFRNKLGVLRFQETVLLLNKALFFIHHVLQHNGNILLVNTDPKYSKVVKEAAARTNQHYVNENWVGGLLTNWQQMRISLNFFQKFEQHFHHFLLQENIVFPKYNKAKRRFQGMTTMKKQPDVIILFQVTGNEAILKEAKTLKIPTVALVATTVDGGLIDFPVPVNDNSLRFIHFFCHLLVKLSNKSSLE